MQQRLFEITTLLTARGSVTAGELAGRFGVSRRTIYRDIDTLSAAGVPVYADRGRGGGIKLLPGYVLEKSLFSTEEQNQLMAHFQSLASLGTPGTEAVLDKLAALFGRRDAWLEVDFTPWDGGEESRQVFRELRDAILQRRPVQFRYTGATGEDTLRQVEPCKVLFRGQGWYLYGFCRKRQDYRFFKLPRMRDFAVLEGSFAPRTPPASMAEAAVQVGPPVDVVLLADKRAAFRVYDEFPPEQITRLATGDFELRCAFPGGPWIHGFILSYGGLVQVLEPPQLRKAIAGEINKMREMYTDAQ